MDLLRILKTPRCWLQNYTYSNYCEEWCTDALKNPVVTDVTKYTAVLNGKQIWIENRPYAFRFTKLDVRPSRATILKIYDLLPSDTRDEAIEFSLEAK